MHCVRGVWGYGCECVCIVIAAVCSCGFLACLFFTGSQSAPPVHHKMRKSTTAGDATRRSRTDMERSMQRLSTPRKQHTGPPPEPMSLGAPRRSSPKPGAGTAPAATKSATASPAKSPLPPKIILSKPDSTTELKVRTPVKKEATQSNKVHCRV